MTTLEHMWRKRWQEDMSQIARALDLDPETIPEGDGRDAILNAIARVRRDAVERFIEACKEKRDAPGFLLPVNYFQDLDTTVRVAESYVKNYPEENRYD